MADLKKVGEFLKGELLAKTDVACREQVIENDTFIHFATEDKLILGTIKPDGSYFTNKGDSGKINLSDLGGSKKEPVKEKKPEQKKETVVQARVEGSVEQNIPQAAKSDVPVEGDIIKLVLESGAEKDYKTPKPLQSMNGGMIAMLVGRIKKENPGCKIVSDNVPEKYRN